MGSTQSTKANMFLSKEKVEGEREREREKLEANNQT